MNLLHWILCRNVPDDVDNGHASMMFMPHELSKVTSQLVHMATLRLLRFVLHPIPIVPCVLCESHWQQQQTPDWLPV